MNNKETLNEKDMLNENETLNEKDTLKETDLENTQGGSALIYTKKKGGIVSVLDVVLKGADKKYREKLEREKALKGGKDLSTLTSIRISNTDNNKRPERLEKYNKKISPEQNCNV